MKRKRQGNWRFFVKYIRLDFNLIMFAASLDLIFSKSSAIFKLFMEYGDIWQIVDYNKIEKDKELEDIRKYYGWSQRELKENKDILYLIGGGLK